ncbi:hypothetical protein DXC78_03980 [Faecalicoccus pleomorphus]|uniref:Uncharacterized protein n=1 Tax=Faecalicoccus pleomorphus TaxID=1323 RepID=A0A3E3E5Q0_9FIRM|nr:MULTISPECIES: hypothetical protein [Faecalicoccus]MDY5110087.1 hypothetical protein [Faecalicoccus sp.]RGD77093.1 hypothetical protein DXC78_03980 [Faecalicoccus pleomorphus]
MSDFKIMNDPLYDDSYPMKLLEQAFEMQVEQAEKATNKLVSDILKSQEFDPRKLSEGKEKMRLVVDGSDDFIKDYQDGVIKLAKEKGHVVAQIKNNGKYGPKLPIKEETYVDGPNSLEIMNACQLKNIADSLQELSNQMLAIDENIKEVLRGQQNDRLGLYYSGVSLYLEANRVSDPAFKIGLISQSLKALSDANYQLVLTMQSDISYLKRKEYESDKRHKFNLMNEKVNLMNEKVNNINKAFSAIHQATLMKAAIYCQCGEINAMTSVFNEYALFIQNTVVPNAKLLTQCDMNDTGKLDGTWSSRSLLLNKVIRIVNQLNGSDEELPIGIGGKESESM